MPVVQYFEFNVMISDIIYRKKCGCETFKTPAPTTNGFYSSNHFIFAATAFYKDCFIGFSFELSISDIYIILFFTLSLISTCFFALFYHSLIVFTVCSSVACEGL